MPENGRPRVPLKVARRVDQILAVKLIQINCIQCFTAVVVSSLPLIPKRKTTMKTIASLVLIASTLISVPS